MLTASLRTIILICMINVFEKRHVATIDIPGAFLSTKIPKGEDNVHLILDGRMVELLAIIAFKTY